MKNGLFGETFGRMDSLMKKSIFLFLLFLLVSGTGFSQRIYSKQQLEQASMEELNAYLKLSEKKKTTGTILSVAGPVALLAGGIVFNENWDKYGEENYTKADAGGYLILAGIVSTIIGVPMLIKGSSRVKRITGIMDAKTVSFELAPCRFQDLLSHRTPAGMALRLTF